MGRGWKRIALDADTAPVPYPTAFFQVDQTTSTRQALPGHQRERRQDADMVRRGHLCAGSNRQEGAKSRCLALHLSTDPVGLGLRENPDFMRLPAISIPY